MRVSALMAGGEPDAIRRTLASLARQRAVAWELCLAVPPSVEIPATSGMRVVRTTATGAAAYAACLAQATGDVVMLLAAGDEVPHGAWARAVAALAAAPGSDVVYGDEDRVTASGFHHAPFLRPAWSPEYLLTALYVDRAFVARRTAVEDVGGIRPEFDPVPEWDLLLRLAERGRPFARVTEMLLHRAGERGDPWRRDDPALVDAGRRAVEAACRRRGEDADVTPRPALAGAYRVTRRTTPARVAVVVPFRDGAGLLRRCVDGIFATTAAGAVELVLVDNGSVEAETTALRAALGTRSDVRVVDAPGPFNFAALVNRGIAAATAPVVCLLNSDVEPRPGWLEALVAALGPPDVGAVGAKLLYPDGSIQHAGIACGLGGTTGHLHRFAPGAASGYFGSAAVAREVSAVTGACLAVRRDAIARVGGFDEALPGNCNDVDFCLRLWAHGYRVVWTPDAQLVHHEGASRGRADDARAAEALMRARWGTRLADDPFLHPGLDRSGEDVRPAPPARRPGSLARQTGRVAWLARDVGAAIAGWAAVPWAAAAGSDPAARPARRGMKVVHVVARYGPVAGSAGRWSAGVATALAAAGHDVTVLTLAPDAAAGPSDDDVGAVRVRRFAPSPPLWALHRLRAAEPAPRSVALRGALVRAIAGADVVHAIGTVVPEAGWTRVLCRLLFRPLVVTSACEPDAAPLAPAGAVPPTAGAADRLVVVPADAGRDAVIAVVDGVRLLRLDGWPLAAAIVGDANVCDAWTCRVWQAGRVPVHEVPAVDAATWAAMVRDAAAVVVPAGADPGTAYDAWAAGTPVIAPGRASDDAVVACRAGDPLALARELASLLRDDDRRAALVARATARAATLPRWTEVAARVADVYAALLARPRVVLRGRATDRAAGPTTSARPGV